MTVRIGLTTCYEFAGKPLADFSVLQSFVEKNELDIVLETPIWNDQSVDWTNFSLIMVDTTWDYHKQPEAFSTWLDQLAELDTPVINPIPLIKWNMSKKYLLELQNKQIRIPLSLNIPKYTAISEVIDRIQSVFDPNLHKYLVIKPLISASSYRTAKIPNPLNQHGLQRISEIIDQQDLIVQEYISQIHQGEYSVIFIDGIFTHSMIKIPKNRDFKSQREFGGTVQKVDPTSPLLDFSRRILNTLPVHPVYARIDIVGKEASCILMECEVIEPYLYLSESEQATELLIQAFLKEIR